MRVCECFIRVVFAVIFYENRRKKKNEYFVKRAHGTEGKNQTNESGRNPRYVSI